MFFRLSVPSSSKTQLRPAASCAASGPTAPRHSAWFKTRRTRVTPRRSSCFLFDLLHLDGKAIAPMPLTERKERLRALLSDASSLLDFSDHQIGRGRAFYDRACALKVEGIVSKRVDAPYAPGNRGLWLKVKCLNREEFSLRPMTNRWRGPAGSTAGCFAQHAGRR